VIRNWNISRDRRSCLVAAPVLIEEHWTSPSLGRSIYLRRSPALGRTRGSVLLLEGLGDHARAHDPMARVLSEAGYEVLAFDWPGNGLSEGVRGDGPVSGQVSDLLGELSGLCKTNIVGISAHSTGAFLIILELARRPVWATALSWVHFSSPLLSPRHGQNAFKIWIGRTLAGIFPRLTLSTGVTDADCTSFRPYPAGDPAMALEGRHDRVTLRFAASLLVAESALDAAVDAMPDDCDYLVTSGSEDEVCPVRFSEQFFHRLPGKRKTFYLVSGARHEPLRERDSRAYLGAIHCWLQRFDIP
jgi:alpha-beta hydrolase superfamily lysophospholipase